MRVEAHDEDEHGDEDAAAARAARVGKRGADESEDDADVVPRLEGHDAFVMLNRQEIRGRVERLLDVHDLTTHRDDATTDGLFYRCGGSNSSSSPCSSGLRYQLRGGGSGSERCGNAAV